MRIFRSLTVLFLIFTLFLPECVATREKKDEAAAKTCARQRMTPQGLYLEKLIQRKRALKRRVRQGLHRFSKQYSTRRLIKKQERVAPQWTATFDTTDGKLLLRFKRQRGTGE